MYIFLSAKGNKDRSFKKMLLKNDALNLLNSLFVTEIFVLFSRPLFKSLIIKTIHRGNRHHTGRLF